MLSKAKLRSEEKNVLGRARRRVVEGRALERSVQLDVSVWIPIRSDRERPRLPARPGRGQTGREGLAIDRQHRDAGDQLKCAPMAVGWIERTGWAHHADGS